MQYIISKWISFSSAWLLPVGVIYHVMMKARICSSSLSPVGWNPLIGTVPSGWLGRLRARPQPSARDSFPLVTCGFLQKRGQRGALVAVCTPTLKSASKKHQNCAPPSLSTAYGTLKVVKRTVYCVCVFLPQAKIFPSPLYVTSKHEQATREFW